MKTRILGVALALASLVPAGYAATPIVFDLTAVYERPSEFGYTPSTFYTFKFTTGESFASNSASSFAVSDGLNANNTWTENNVAHDSLWATVTGSGISGLYGNQSNPNNILHTNNDVLQINVGANSTGTTGLKSLDGSVAFKSISFAFTLSPLAGFTYSGAYSEPTEYFSNFLGDYYTGQSSSYIDLNDFMGHSVGLRITSLSISSIPEPSTYAAIFGALALGSAAYRRRQARA